MKNDVARGSGKYLRKKSKPIIHKFISTQDIELFNKFEEDTINGILAPIYGKYMENPDGTMTKIKNCCK